MDNKKLLWLDDERDPMESEFLNKFCPEYSNNKENIVWVKNYEEFELWIYNNGLPYKISFDHDLADEHYAPKNKWNDYESWVKGVDFKEKTGMDCANFLINYCLDYNKELPMWSVHSANPAGAKNIRSKLTNFLKHQNKK